MTQAVQSVIDRALASGRKVTLVVIGGDRKNERTSEEEPQKGAGDTGARQPEGDPARWTPLQRLEAAIAAGGEGTRKESDWADVVCRPDDFSGRELERACRKGAIEWTKKDDGRDAGAREIESKALGEYLELRERVRHGREPAPEWWEMVVVQKRHRSAR